MVTWQDGAQWRGLLEGRPDAWRLRTDWLTPDDLSAFTASLSQEERAEADRRTSPRARDDLIAARVLTRSVLARCLDVEPIELHFERDDRGRPYVAGDLRDAAIDFNLSHTRGVVLIATRRTERLGERVGIDVEHARRHVEWRRLANRFFSVADVEAISSLPASRQLEGFLTCWCRKEALVKAHGAGIARAFGAFGVSANPSQSPELDASNEPPWDREAWRLYDLPMQSGYYACLAASTPVDGIQLWEWKTSSKSSATT